MRRAGARPLVWLTEAPWHAAELARQLGQAGSPVICAVGGDGTVHEVVNGLLDVCHARGLGRLQILRLLPEVMRGTHVDNEPVTMARGRRVRVWSEIPLPVQADGELFPAPVSELDVEILPHSLTVRS